MKTIYLMRHGQTLFNVMAVNQGQCDSPLTELGIQQAKNAGAWFQNHGITFDTVYCSTAERACDTAELVSGGIPCQRLKGLKEIFLGTKEASSYSENPSYPYGDFFVQYGGESLEEVTKRVYGTMKDIAEADNGDTILVVSHGMAIKRFLEAISYIKGEYKGILGNCGIVRLHYEDGNFTVEQVVNPNSKECSGYLTGNF